jgi:hypothetical protein
MDIWIFNLMDEQPFVLSNLQLLNPTLAFYPAQSLIVPVRQESHRRYFPRWRAPASLRKGVVLPGVELVRDGNEFYFRDGHHRISVTKVMGQLENRSLHCKLLIIPLYLLGFMNRMIPIINLFGHKTLSTR